MLRTLLKANPETLQDFDGAAEEKYWEGLELMTSGHPGGGIYLLGYAAEMILKHAAFRVQGHVPATPVAGLFGPVGAFMKATHPGVDREGYHSVVYWATYLRARRRQLGRPLPAALDAELAARSQCLYENWWVEMRYRPDRARAEDVQQVYNDVSWLRAQRVALRS